MENKSHLYLLKDVDLDPTYNYTIDFNSKDEQSQYFDEKIEHDLIPEDDYSFIRKDETIKVERNIDELDNVNYLYFINGGRRWYAFITDKQYIADDVTKIFYTIDPLQTFMFDYEWQETFIDREHQDRFSKDKKPIYNLQPENLEIGNEYEVKKSNEIGANVKDAIWCIIKAKEPICKIDDTYNSQGEVETWKDDTIDVTFQRPYKTSRTGIIPSGIYVYIAPITSWGKVYLTEDKSKWADVFNVPQEVFEDPRVISISATRYMPSSVKYLEGAGFYMGIGGRLGRYYKPDGSDTATTLFRVQTIDDVPWLEFQIDVETPSPATINDPFSFLRMNVFNKFKEFKKENFKNAPSWNMIKSIGVNGVEYIIPQNYNNSERALFDSFQNTFQSELTLRTDAWQEYIMNNKASLNGGLVTGAISTAASIGLGALTGGLGWALAGGQALNFGVQVANELIKREDIKNQPDQIKSSADDGLIGLVTTADQIIVDEMEIKPFFKEKIGKYFIHFGYKANTFEKPNTKSRYYFNYIKTIGANIKTNIDNRWRNEITDIFDKGITIWHYRDKATFKGVNNYDFENVEMNLIGE